MANAKLAKPKEYITRYLIATVGVEASLMHILDCEHSFIFLSRIVERARYENGVIAYIIARRAWL